MITLSINVLELDRTRFKHVDKRNGQKAAYVDLVLIETPNSEYGDYIVKQGVSKQEREAGKQMPILGNGKNFQSRGGGPSAKHSAPEEPADPAEPPHDDDVPF